MLQTALGVTGPQRPEHQLLPAWEPVLAKCGSPTAWLSPAILSFLDIFPDLPASGHHTALLAPVRALEPRFTEQVSKQSAAEVDMFWGLCWDHEVGPGKVSVGARERGAPHRQKGAGTRDGLWRGGVASFPSSELTMPVSIFQHADCLRGGCAGGRGRCSGPAGGKLSSGPAL